MPLTYEEFHQFTRELTLALRIKNFRRGQAYYHALFNVNEELAIEITGNDNLDPFLLDDNIERFMRYIQGV